ncbi:DUF7322 domain-containing protein [Halapricum desulfuricans]|uniref:Putative membrane protein n=1 Tax=Halapricum desulfuricans TaxID=2841257 RepID=A0A897N6T3_9EURY|nr:hypothetical protein [Halapricum desulfuricans]QSG06759.1 putative membrane protein [Halapricum desulfuricans]
MSNGPGEPPSHEPEEFDPDSLGPDTVDPASLGPETPSAPDPPDGSEVDREIHGLFWWLAALANVALLAASLGVMFVVFRARWTLGAQLTLSGLIVGGYVYYRVRQFQSE